MTDKIAKACILWGMGGVAYMLIEMCARGYSHWTMALLGGACFLAVGALNERLPWEMPLWLQMFIGGLLITALEFVTGCIVNLWLGWSVWDYSAEKYNLFGQICPKFTAYWILLSGVAIVLDDWLRYLLFDEGMPRYKLF